MLKNRPGPIQEPSQFVEEYVLRATGNRGGGCGSHARLTSAILRMQHARVVTTGCPVNRVGFGSKRHRVPETEKQLWDELSAAEQELELFKAAQEYREWWRTLSHTQRWAERRRAELKVARSYRTAFREVGIEPFYEGLKRTQKRLLKLRIERTTGLAPGQA